MARDKFRIRFRKCRDLRLLSHHDLMRCFERMLRRSALPFHSTQGFNPKPRLVFALSLALGIEGHDEAADLELDESLPEQEVQERLSRQAPAGLEILSVRRIDPKTTAQPRRAVYQIPVPPERMAALAARVQALLAEPNCWVERTRPHARRIDLRPYVLDLRVLPEALEMDLKVTPQGTARPDEVAALLGLGDVLAAGAVLRRTKLELHDSSEG
jgi:radical SAM-linked protein